MAPVSADPIPDTRAPGGLRRIRVLACVIGVGLIAGLAGCGSADSGEANPALAASATPTAAPKPKPPRPTLPDGTRSILPEHRVLIHYGAPQARGLGILGIGTPSVAGRRLTRHAKRYQAELSRPVLPAMELIAVIASAGPGNDGKYRYRQTNAVIGRYLAAARASDAILILDIQPGRSDFVTEAKAFERWLREPDVSLAIDPEWRMGPREVPARVIGRVDAVEVNRVSAYLSSLARKHDLPDKLLIVHQFTDGMILRRERLRDRARVDLVLNADGFGTPGAKAATYRRVTANRPAGFVGFKLFYEEDTNLMTPAAVLRLRPRPDIIMYE